MFKNKNFNISDKYSEHLYSGIMGVMMRYCHNTLENFSSNKNKFNKILEIGAGVEPHDKYIKHQYDEYHILETSDFALEQLSLNKKYILHKYNGDKLPFENETFDRIIISHSLEHIDQPEIFINNVMKILKINGIFSISLPTDPGVLWRMARYVNGFFKAKKVYKISRLEYNYINATEHVNPIFNLISLIRYNYKDSHEEYFYPIRLKLADLNFFYNVHIHKR
jgi:SAM-dependent methyltransferase|tara:strand:- start:20 stop:688 length:669 start_codon:yes stop_codon:yes gene_type:complete